MALRELTSWYVTLEIQFIKISKKKVSKKSEKISKKNLKSWNFWEMLIKILLAVICSVFSCTAWSKRELTEYEKLQIMARDYHFDYIQMVGYEERRPKINPRQKKRKRSGTGTRNDLERMLKRQLRHHQHISHHHRSHQQHNHHRHHNRKVTVDWTRRYKWRFRTARTTSESDQRWNWWPASAADRPCRMAHARCLKWPMMCFNIPNGCITGYSQ